MFSVFSLSSTQIFRKLWRNRKLFRSAGIRELENT